MTALELIVALTILAAAIQMTVSALTRVGDVGPDQRERSVALEAARDRLERLRAEDPALVFVSHNADPADDPAGPGTAEGAGFAVAGLEAQDGDADGLPGRIEFLTLAGALREDLADRDFGMPRDLNLDGVIDTLDHAADYLVLPFRVHVEWRGADRLDHRLALQGSLIVE